MNSNATSGRPGAFTLVELLTVIAIIAILAALLMPVLNKGEMRAKRVVCINDLSQVGLAFHAFAGDHSGKFPMAVSTNDGGSLEYVQSGFSAGPTFYTAYCQFQVLSNELVFPRILNCPNDLRPAATSFQSFQNGNLSYFAGVNATFDRPESILAGDRNLATNSWFQQTILQLTPGANLWWTWEMHQHKGNVLFADGHVEEWNDSSLISDANQLPGNQIFFLPSVLQTIEPPVTVGNGPGGPNSGAGPPAGGNGPVSVAGSGSGSGFSGPGVASPKAAGSGSSAYPDSIGHSQAAPVSYPGNYPAYQPVADAQLTRGAAVSAGATNESDSSEDGAVGMSDFNRNLTQSLQHGLWWIFWLWLLLALYLGWRLWKWFQHRDAKLRAKMKARQPPG